MTDTGHFLEQVLEKEEGKERSRALKGEKGRLETMKKNSDPFTVCAEQCYV